MGQMDRRGDSELVRCQSPKGFPPVSSCRVLLTSTQCQMFLRCVEVDPSQILLCGANGARPWCDSLLRVKACLSHGLINVHPWKKARWWKDLLAMMSSLRVAGKDAACSLRNIYVGLAMGYSNKCTLPRLHVPWITSLGFSFNVLKDCLSWIRRRFPRYGNDSTVTGARALDLGHVNTMLRSMLRSKQGCSFWSSFLILDRDDSLSLARKIVSKDCI